MAVDPISIRETTNTPWGEEEPNPQLRKVLDHGYIRLVSHMGNDLSIVRAARVSYNADWRAGTDSGSDARLIRYLLRNGHTSPFEHVVFTCEVKAPIFVLRQWMRHRTWSYNEVSARYTELPEEFYVPEYQTIGVQSSDNKQARDIEKIHPDSVFFMSDINHVSWYAFDYYKRLIRYGCPREVARMILPVNTYSHMFATVDLHNLFKFLKERLHPHAQYEIRVYAEALLDLIKPIVPVAVEAWSELTNGAAPAAKGV